MTGFETITTAAEGETLSSALWVHRGFAGRGLLDTALAATPGLAALGPVLPAGTAINVPVETADPGVIAETPQIVTLWD